MYIYFFTNKEVIYIFSLVILQTNGNNSNENSCNGTTIAPANISVSIALSNTQLLTVLDDGLLNNIN